MPDDPTPADATADARDERIAGLLAVEPLDEMTRRRLVRGALEHPAESRWARWTNVAAVAAAIAVGAGIGAVLVNDPDPPPAQTAAAPTEPADPAAESTMATELQPAAGDAVAPIQALGDLGDVSTRGALRDAVDTRLRGGDADEEAARQSASAFSYPCVSAPPTDVGVVAIVAAGSATYNNLTVTVVVGTSPEGESLAVVLAQPPGCEVLRSVVLPRG